MGEPNWANRTIWTGDNLDVVRGMNSASVDLIYLDPPFKSDRTYAAPIGSKAAGAFFKDTWTLNDVDEAAQGEIRGLSPALWQAIEAAGMTHSAGMKAYLIMMTQRLLELHRALKATGSLYLHCDPTASHYLKTVLDGVFGKDNFRNEIIWKRTWAHNNPKRFGRITDVILNYSKSAVYTWNAQHVPYSDEYIRKAFRYKDERGRFATVLLTGAGTRTGESGEAWRGYDPTESGRHWAVPRRVIEKLAGREALRRSIGERLELLDEQGYIHWPRAGRVPMLKQYLEEMPGPLAQNLWDDIKRLSAQSKERIGFPTQKPVQLLKRIIAASSNPGEVVLDPFCGCATACVAAEQLERQWVGIDLSAKAAELVKWRMERELGTLFPVDHRRDMPRRTDRGRLPPYRTQKQPLYGAQEGRCAGCCEHFQFRNLTVDHIVPVSKGGDDHVENLQLLCGACNSMKGRRSQAQFHAMLRRRGLRTAGGCKDVWG